MKDRTIILGSNAGKRMLEMVSPIYDGSYTGLWMMEVMGREYDALRGIVESMVEQITPRTASWSLPFWEAEYGIVPTGGETILQRRAAVLARRQSVGAFTPYKVKAMAEALTGVSARVVDGERPYTLIVYLSVASAEERRLRRELDRVKPAHLSYAIEYEQSATGQLYFGCAMTHSATIEIRQAN